jgi:hypothetical protein
MGPITRDLFYQLLLAHWEAVPLLALAQPLHVGQLMGLALEHEEAAGRWQVRVARQRWAGHCSCMCI